MKNMALYVFVIVFLFSSCKPENTNEITNTNDTDNSVILVETPATGESILEGTTYNIKWSGNRTSKVKIRYTIDNGANWFFIADNLPNTGSYMWNPVPNKISDRCKIIIDALDGTATGQNNGCFSIIRNNSQTIMLRAPNGLEHWEAGSQKQIIWSSSGIDSVKIDYTTDNGSNWKFVAVDKINTGVYLWNPVPNTPSSSAKVRVMDARDNTPVTESERTFSILPEPRISIISPNGGERWVSGTDQEIKWESENVLNVKIQYTTNGGADWFTITETTPAVGNYIWRNIHLRNSTLCKVQIFDPSDNYPITVSANYFTITDRVEKTIEVLAPIGGETFEIGSVKEIKWKSANVQYATIEFTTNNGNTWETIANRIANYGVLEWTVPDKPSILCKIRVKDSDDAAVFGLSNNFFSIRPPQSIKLIYPNGNETIRTGDNLVIQWQSTGVENVRIQYGVVTGSGVLNWIDLVSSIPGNGSFQIVFNAAPGEYKIRISDALDGVPSDESDSGFIVLPKL